MGSPHAPMANCYIGSGTVTPETGEYRYCHHRHAYDLREAPARAGDGETISGLVRNPG